MGTKIEWRMHVKSNGEYMMNIKKEFEIKLEKLSIKDKFILNISVHINRLNLNSETHYEKINNSKSWFWFIKNAFDWEETPQGTKYWGKIASNNTPVEQLEAKKYNDEIDKLINKFPRDKKNGIIVITGGDFLNKVQVLGEGDVFMKVLLEAMNKSKEFATVIFRSVLSYMDHNPSSRIAFMQQINSVGIEVIKSMITNEKSDSNKCKS